MTPGPADGWRGEDGQARPPLSLALSRPGWAEEAPEGAREALMDDEKAMRLAEWAYYHVEEVWSGFNLIAEGVARGFRVKAPSKKLQAGIEAWNDRVNMSDAVRMWVRSALVYGRAVMEATPEFLNVRNPRFVDLEQSEDGALVGAWQRTASGRVPVPVERVRVFTLHRMFTNDLLGVSAVHPVLGTVDDMVEARKVNRAIARRYRAPIRVVELPADATPDDQDAIADQLVDTPPDMDMVLPPGARVHVMNHGKDFLQPDALMKEHLTDRIFMGLGVPKVALGIPDGSNRSVSEVQREMLLADKVAPYQRQLRHFAEGLYADLFGQKPAVLFDPVDVRDEREVAEVSRILVEAGIKTPQEVAEHWWKWG